jgi:5-methylcytosine-specific restriction enzyme A
MPYRVHTHKCQMPGPTSQQEYDRKRRDPESKEFYNSARWKKVREQKLIRDPYCEDHLERGEQVPASTVHHERALREHPEQALDYDNLRSSCASCHSRRHAQQERK